MKILPTLRTAFLSIIATLAACDGGGGKAEKAAAPIRDVTAEAQAYYKTKVSVPPAIHEAFERGEVTQEQIDKRSAAGEFPNFFRFATPKEIPVALVWEDGSDLPEFASPQAKKGGTLHSFIDDFPRTLRTTGPDANGSFRQYILDDNVMYFARRHPNDTSIGPNGFRYYPGVAKAWAVYRAS